MFVCAVLGIATPSLSADPTTVPPEETSRGVALNQSVSIDDPETAATPAASNGAQASAEGAVDQPDSKGLAAMGAGGQKLLRREATTRAVRSRRPSIEDGSSPWYRTGLGALGIVLAVVAGSAYLLRRWLPSSRLGETGAMRVVGRVGLTPKHTLALVRVGRRFVMVGVSGDRLTTLCEMGDADEVAELAARVDTAAGTRSEAFEDMLAHEGAAYRRTPEPRRTRAVDGDVSKSSVGDWSRNSVGALLRRLKTLQTK